MHTHEPVGARRKTPVIFRLLENVVPFETPGKRIISQDHSIWMKTGNTGKPLGISSSVPGLSEADVACGPV